MYDISNNTDAAQHHHDNDHGTAGSDVIANNDNNSNSESTHDNEERNHDKPEKESTDMNRIIKNSIAPVLAVFTLSVMFAFSPTTNAMGFNANTCDRYNFDNVTATADFNRDELNDGTVDCSCKDDLQLNRFTDNKTFKDGDQNITRIDDYNLNGFRGMDVDDTRDANLARFNADTVSDDLNRPDVDMVNDIGNNVFASFDIQNSVREDDVCDEVNFIRANDNDVVALDNCDLNILDGNQIARVNVDGTDNFNPDSFSRGDFRA